MTRLGLTVFTSMEVLVLFGAFLAWRDNFLTGYEMTMLRGVPEGLPFVFHEAMWSDFLIISTIVGLIVSWHAGEWSRGAILLALVCGTLASGGMHWTYLQSTMMEAHVQNGHLTHSGIVHVAYMAIGFSVLFLYFFATQNVNPREMMATSLLIFVHVFFATHIPLYWWGPNWIPVKPFADPNTMRILAATAGALILRNSIYLLAR